MKQTNVIYITIGCVFACDYCYEKDLRASGKVRDITTAEIDEILPKIHAAGDTDVVIFGGEPLTRFDLVEYTVRSGLKYGFHFFINTNGALLANEAFFKKFMELYRTPNLTFTVEISYDGSGQSRRIFKGGSSTLETVERAINNCLNAGVRLDLRYSIHKTNIDHVIRDTVTLLERFKGVGKIYYNLISEIRGDERLEAMKPKLRYLESLYKVPLDVLDKTGATVNNYLPDLGFFEFKEAANATNPIPEVG